MTQQETTHAFDPQQKRPLEFCVRDMQDEGGISEEVAQQRGAHAADALVLLRFLVDGGKISLALQSVNGTTHEALGYEALFSAWLSFTGYLTQLEAGEEMQKRQGFLRYMLKLLALDEQFGVIQTASGAQESPDPQSDAAAPTSD